MAKAKVGDFIKITQGSGWYRDKVGEVYEVIEGYFDGSKVYVRNPEGEEPLRYLVSNGNYEILPQSPPKDYEEADSAEPVTQADAVNSPPHYTQGKHEVIDIIEQITSGYTDGFVAYALGNTLKYISRAPFKHENPTEDIKKAIKYLEFALKHLEKEGS